MNISVVKNVTNNDLKRVESFIVNKNDQKARFPGTSLVEIAPQELKSGKYSTLIIQGGTNEISNLDVSGNLIEKIESLKQEGYGEEDEQRLREGREISQRH